MFFEFYVLQFLISDHRLEIHSVGNIFYSESLKPKFSNLIHAKCFTYLGKFNDNLETPIPAIDLILGTAEIA